MTNKCQECGNRVNAKGLKLGDDEWIHEKCLTKVLDELNKRKELGKR